MVQLIFMVWQNKLSEVDIWVHSPIAKIKGKINNRNGEKFYMV